MSGACEDTVVIQNKFGLHARPAAEFVKTAHGFDAEVWVRKEDLEVNGKSIMGMMMLAAEHGSEIVIRAAGSDENIQLTPPLRYSLEQALEFIDDDELVEITPSNIRLRKKLLAEGERRRDERQRKKQAGI